MSQLAANARVVGALGMRAVRQTFRRPQLMAPILMFPTLLLAVQTGGAGAAVNLPGFPRVHGFLDFMLAGAMMQSLMLAGNSGGIAMAVDLEMGFTDRLFAAPIPRFAIVLGRLAGSAALGVLSAVWFIALGLIFGARIEDGVAGRPLRDVRFTDSILRLLAATEALTAQRRLVSEGEFYGRRFACGVLCPALRASGFRVTGATTS